MTKRARACDFCRRRKIRCEPHSSTDETRCESCVEFGIRACTYEAPTGRTEPSYAYAHQLEKRLKSLECLVQKRLALSPNSPSNVQKNSREKLAWSLPQPGRINGGRGPALGLDGSSTPCDDATEVFFATNRGRYFGTSSFVPLLDLVKDLKDDPTGGPDSSAELAELGASLGDATPWNYSHDSSKELAIASLLPNPSTLRLLLDLYERHIAPFWPIIHRATFEAQCADLVHMRDHSQAQLVLVVCAIASVYTAEARDMKGEPPGWEYFSAVRELKYEIMTMGAAPAELVDVQIIALQAIYYLVVGRPHSAWLVLGTGIRLSQDVGAHRASFAETRRPLEAEMWKRVFWCFVSLDRFTGTQIGHSPMILEEHFDLELPSEPVLEGSIEQHKLEYFNSNLQLGWYSSMAQRALLNWKAFYKVYGYFSTKEEVVARVDSLLERWVESLPDRLRWNPHNPNLLDLEQSAELHTARFYIVMITHRPMEASATNSTTIPMSEQDISGQAALKCVEILVTLLRRSPAFFSPNMGQCFITSSLILLTRLWALQRRPYMRAEVIMKVKDAYEDTVSGMEEFARRWPPAARSMMILDLLLHDGDPKALRSLLHPANGQPHDGAPIRRCSRTTRESSLASTSCSHTTHSLPTPPEAKSHDVNPSPQATVPTTSSASLVDLQGLVAPGVPLPWLDFPAQSDVSQESVLREIVGNGIPSDPGWLDYLEFPWEPEISNVNT